MTQLAILLELFAMNKNLREINEQTYSRNIFSAN